MLEAPCLLHTHLATDATPALIPLLPSLPAEVVQVAGQLVANSPPVGLRLVPLGSLLHLSTSREKRGKFHTLPKSNSVTK